MIIMGIDPGFAITGYGIVKYEGNRFIPMDFGAIITKSSMKLLKLSLLYNQLGEIIKKFKPEAISIEELF